MPLENSVSKGNSTAQELLQRSLIGMSLPLSPLTLTGMGKLHQLLDAHDPGTRTASNRIPASSGRQ